MTRTTINLEMLTTLADNASTPKHVAKILRDAIPALEKVSKVVQKKDMEINGLALRDTRTGRKVFEPRNFGEMGNKAFWLNTDYYVFDIRKDTTGESVLVITRK